MSDIISERYKIVERLGDTMELAKPGMKVKYIGTDDYQVNWGGNDDPRGVLVEGGLYTVDKVEVHTWHTKYHINGKRYNSVSFEPLPAPPAGDAPKSEPKQLANIIDFRDCMGDDWYD